MNGKIKQKGLFRVSLYFNEPELTSMALEAERLHFRTVGIPIKKQKPNGFANEWLANTDGVGKLLKYCYAYWKDAEPKRLEELAEISRQKKELEAKEKRLGAK